MIGKPFVTQVHPGSDLVSCLNGEEEKALIQSTRQLHPDEAMVLHLCRHPLLVLVISRSVAHLGQCQRSR